jgi:hypothetical protein
MIAREARDILWHQDWTRSRSGKRLMSFSGSAGAVAGTGMSMSVWLEVFGKMLEEARKCTKASNWVPRPPGGKATIAWLVRNVTRSAIRSMGNDLACTCVQFVIRNWDSEPRLVSALS